MTLELFRFAGVALILSPLSGLALAEGRAEVLQILGARVAVLATAWEPDLQAAVQAFSDQDLGFARWPQKPSEDPWRAEAVSALPQADGAEISVGAVNCLRMGAQTLRFYAENIDLSSPSPSPSPSPLPGADRNLIADTRFNEMAFLSIPGPDGLGEPPAAATAVMSCVFYLRAAWPLDGAALAGFSAGLSSGFDGVAEVAGEVAGQRGPMTGVIRIVPMLTAQRSTDPLTHLGSFTLSRVGQEEQSRVGQERVLTFVVWRLAPES